jgi:hypothetical protein
MKCRINFTMILEEVLKLIFLTFISKVKDCNVEGFFFDLFLHICLLGDGYFLGRDGFRV